MVRETRAPDFMMDTHELTERAVYHVHNHGERLGSGHGRLQVAAIMSELAAAGWGPVTDDAKRIEELRQRRLQTDRMTFSDFSASHRKGK